MLLKRKWANRFTHPDAIGVIDGTLIPIQKPPARFHPDEYICRKGYHAINVLIVRDAEERHTTVDIRWPGSTHDARVFSNSDVKRILEQDDSDGAGLLLGDSGFGIARYLMVPFPNPNNES